MNLSHYDFENVFFISPEIVNVLVIEDEQKFYHYCSELQSQISLGNGNFCLSEKEKQLSLAKCTFMFESLFDFQLNDKKTIGKLHQSLEEAMDMKFPEDCSNIKQSFQIIFDKLNSECDYSIEYNDEDLVSKLFKIYDVKLSEENTFLESLIARMKSMAAFFNVKCFFFINLKTFLNSQQLNELYKEMLLEEINIFLLENTVKEKLNHEFMVILDRDLCEIVVEKEKCDIIETDTL